MSWAVEDAAVAADAAMDRGVPCAELWRYLPPSVVQTLSTYPEQFATLFISEKKYRARAWAGKLSSALAWVGVRANAHALAGAGVQAGMRLQKIKPRVRIGMRTRGWTRVLTGEDGA